MIDSLFIAPAAPEQETSIESRRLSPLRLFTTVSEAERYIDTVASKLGVPMRAEACWINACARELRYRDKQNRLELAVLITSNRLIEREPTW